MKEMLDGNEAAAVAAKLARVKVVSAYPITPQTTVVEKLAEFIANGELDAEFIKVESEHSAMSACIGAAATGVRTFTATSSQGLMLMSEMLFVAAGMRLPIVMTNANRALSAPLNIWCDQQDSMAVRDSGWIQLYCENNQEILDTTLQAFRIAEEVMLPVMVCYDGYILSHTAEPVDVPEQSSVDEFLPLRTYPHPLDPEKPVTLGPVGVPEYYTEIRYTLQGEMLNAKKVVKTAGREFKKKFGRKSETIECYRTEDAEVVLVTLGALAGSLREIVEKYRKRGARVGMVKMKLFRPFPAEEILKALDGVKGVGVLEKDISLGFAGALFLDIAAALAGTRKPPVLMNFICGLGGRDVTELQLATAIKETAKAAEAGRAKHPVRWLGLREKVVGVKER
ncbi:MAG: pyruvate synthase subunit PorA [Candidatus Hadarchaeales archaeon]